MAFSLLPGKLRRRTASPVPLRTHLLLLLRRKLARPCQMRLTPKMDKKMRRRLGDIKLDRGKYQRMPQMQRHHRKGRRLQPHGLQEPELQSRLLLGLPRPLGAPRQLLVQLQPLRRGRGQGGARRAGEIALRPPALPLLLQPLHEPHAVAQIRAQALRLRQGQDGGDAAAQHELDRGAVPEESRRHPVPVPADADVHLRIRLLFEENKPVCDI